MRSLQSPDVSAAESRRAGKLAAHPWVHSSGAHIVWEHHSAGSHLSASSVLVTGGLCFSCLTFYSDSEEAWGKSATAAPET